MLWSDESRLQRVFGKNGCQVLRARDEEDHPDFYQRKVQRLKSVKVWGCISSYGVGNLHMCKGTIDTEAYTGIFERHMPPSRRHLFLASPWLFQQDIARPLSARATKVWLSRPRVHVVDWPACSPDLSPIENV